MAPYHKSSSGRFMHLGMSLFFLSFSVGYLFPEPSIILHAFALIVSTASCFIVISTIISIANKIYLSRTIFYLCLFPFLMWLAGPEIWKSVTTPVTARFTAFLLGAGFFVAWVIPNAPKLKSQKRKNARAGT